MADEHLKNHIIALLEDLVHDESLSCDETIKQLKDVIKEANEYVEAFESNCDKVFNARS